MVAFCALWGAGFFLPAAHVFFFPGTFIAERLLYVPSLGFCLALGVGLRRLAVRVAGRPAAAGRGAVFRGLAVAVSFWALVAGCAAPYALWTRARNAEWGSQQALFASALRVAPGSAKVRLNAGISAWEAAQPAVAAANAGARPASDLAPGAPTDAARRLDAALAHYSAAVAVEPAFDAFCQPHYWAGRAHLDRREFPAALARFQRALSCKELDHDRYAREALEAMYGERLRHVPSDADAAANLANVLLLGGRHAEAAASFARALKLYEARPKGHPRGRAPSADVLTNFAICRRAQGKLKGARKLFRRAVATDPRSARATQGLAQAEAALGGSQPTRGAAASTAKKKKKKKAKRRKKKKAKRRKKKKAKRRKKGGRRRRAPDEL